MLRSTETDRTPDAGTAATAPNHAAPQASGSPRDQGASREARAAGADPQELPALDPNDPNPPAPPQTKPAKISDEGFGSFA